MRLYDLAGADDRHRFSPYCWRVRMALAHKWLPVETVPWRFTERDALAFSGQGRVPVLVDGDRTVTDSFEIARYLDTTYGDRPALFPGGRTEPAWFVKHWAESQVHPTIVPLVLLDLLDLLHPKDRDYFRSSREKTFGRTIEEVCADRPGHLARFRAALEPVRRTLADRPWLGGAEPDFCDYILFGALQWARCGTPQDLLAADDPVFPWFERLLDRFDGLGRSAFRPG